MVPVGTQWESWYRGREGGARRPHIKEVGSQRELPTINWYGWVLNGSFGRERGRGEEATNERGWE